MAAAPTSGGRSWTIVVLGTLCAVLAVALTIVLATRHDTRNATGVAGSGVPATQTRAVAPFTSVELRGSNNVILRTGKTQSVVVHADDNLISRITTRVTGSTLVIDNASGSFSTKSPMSVAVTVPAVKRVVLSGSGNIVASGETARLEATLLGSGNLELARLRSQDVRALLAGSGNIRVTATDSLDATVRGSGVIFYGGTPAHVTTSVPGSGAVLAQ